MASEVARAQSSSAPALSLSPSLEPLVSRVPAGVKSTIQNMPNTMGRHLSDAQVENLYETFRTRTTPSDGSAILDKRVTGAARTILVGSGDRGYAVMDEVSDGDKKINDGGFKTVYHGVGLHDGKHYAIGVCDIASAMRSPGRTEAIVRLFLKNESEFSISLSGLPGLVETPLVVADDNRYFFVMPFYEGGDFFDLLDDLLEGKKKWPLSKSVHSSQQILRSIHTVHQRGIIHRDVKPDNFLLNKAGQFFLGDFGLSARANDAITLMYRAGAPQHIAPEIDLGKPATAKCDTWSAGVVLYNIFALKLLPMQTCPDRTKIAIPHDKNWHPPTSYHFKLVEREQEIAIKKLLAKMLQVDPRARISIAAAAAEMDTIAKSLQPKPKVRPIVQAAKKTPLLNSQSHKIIHTARAKMTMPNRHPLPISASKSQANLKPKANGNNIGAVAPKTIPAPTAKKPIPKVDSRITKLETSLKRLDARLLARKNQVVQSAR